MKINLSIYLCAFFIISCVFFWLLPSSLYPFLLEHQVFARAVYYFVRWVPLVILAVAISEIIKRQRRTLAWTAAICSLVMFLFMHIMTNPTSRDDSLDHDIGHISFNTHGQENIFRYSCVYEFDVYLSTSTEEEKFLNELKSRQQFILSVIKENAMNNCYKSDLESIINETSLDLINSVLKNGSIEQIYIRKITSTVSTSGTN